MPKYYFDLWDNDGLAVDEEGLELSDLAAAQREATGALAGMAREAIVGNAEVATDQMAVEVRDDLGPVLKVSFSYNIEQSN